MEPHLTATGWDMRSHAQCYLLPDKSEHTVTHPALTQPDSTPFTYPGVMELHHGRLIL